MKKSVIKDIFHGFRGHIDTINIPKEDKVKSGIICNTYDELEEKLSPEHLKLHRKLIDALENDWAVDVDCYFAEGFKLGLLIGIECMED